ncbi:MAG: hypothetical protein ACTSWT_11515 [Candidatus Heimdallarchaeota archaeon]
MIDLFSKALSSTLGQSTFIISLTILSFLGVLSFLFLCLFVFTFPLFLLFCCFLLTTIIGSIKTTNSFFAKDKQTTTKNLICNIVLLVLSLVLFVVFIYHKAYYFLIVSCLVSINTIIDLFLSSKNTSQRDRPYIYEIETTKIDRFGLVVKKIQASKNNLEDGFVSLVAFFLSSSFAIFTFILLNNYFGTTEMADKPALLNAFFGLQLIALGLVAFFEVLCLFPFRSSNTDKGHLARASFSVLKDLKSGYSLRRWRHFKFLGVAFLSSSFLFIGTLFMQFFFHHFSGGIRSLEEKFGLHGVHLLRFFQLIYVLASIAIFAFILAILFLGLLSAGYATGHPISGFYAGLLTSMFFSSWILLFLTGFPRHFAIIITELILCPVFGGLTGWLTWRNGRRALSKLGWKKQQTIVKKEITEGA